MLLDFDDDKLISVDEMAWCHQAQAFTKANVDPDLYPHMASLSHSELGYEHIFAVLFLLKNRQYWDLYVFFNKSIAMNLLYLCFCEYHIINYLFIMQFDMTRFLKQHSNDKYHMGVMRKTMGIIFNLGFCHGRREVLGMFKTVAQRSPRRSVARRSLEGGRRKAHTSPWWQNGCTVVGHWSPR